MNNRAESVELKLAGNPRAAGPVSGARKTLTFEACKAEYEVACSWSVK